MLDEEGNEVKMIYYDFEKDKKSSGVFLHNLVEIEEKSEKTPRSKKLRNLTDHLTGQDALVSARSNQQQQHLGRASKTSMMESSRTDKSERSRFNNYVEPKPDAHNIGHGKSSQANESQESIVVQYHKLPKKPEPSKHEPKPVKSRKKEKKAKKTGRSKSRCQKTGAASTNTFDQLNSDEFNKLEEQVKYKFPELFVSPLVFVCVCVCIWLGYRIDNNKTWLPY